MAMPMRVAFRGLLIAYSLIGTAWLFALQLAPRLLPDVGPLGVLFFVGGPFIILHGVALAIFGGSAVCAGRALYVDSVSRTFGGYLVFGLSLLSVVVVGIFWLRELVFAR